MENLLTFPQQVPTSAAAPANTNKASSEIQNVDIRNVDIKNGDIRSSETRIENTLNRYTSLNNGEYTASQIRRLLQQLFPHRKLVLSQFTFFCHAGVSMPSGSQVKRGRRCFKLVDILPMAALLGVKEEGIPYKNVEKLPGMVRDNAEKIFNTGPGVLLSGYGEALSMQFPGESWVGTAIEKFLDHSATNSDQLLFWSYDVGELSRQLLTVVGEELKLLRAA